MSWCDDVQSFRRTSEADLYSLTFQIAKKLDEAEQRIQELSMENDGLRGLPLPLWLTERPELQQRVADLEEREGFWRSYVKLLAKELTGLVSIAHFHGWRSTEADIQKGKELRAQLGINEKQEDV